MVQWYHMETDDDVFREALENLLKESNSFGHRQHVDLAWRFLQLTDPRSAEAQMKIALRHVASKHRTPEKYHETMTIAWARLVAYHAGTTTSSNFEEFIEENPDLLTTQLLAHFYSTSTLLSDAARAQWIEPDVAPLP